MADPIELLSRLSIERKALDDEIAAIMARRELVDARIREAAALVVSGSTTAPVVARAPTTDQFADLQRRQRELLWFLLQHPGEHSEALAKRMYGRADLAAKRSVASYFSRLKASGYVDVEGRGQFKPTAKGRAAALKPKND